METPVQLHELPLSPNSTKVRIALNYKGIPFQRHLLKDEDYPGDRAKVVELSGQPRLPVLQYEDSVVYDSSAILRYLEVRFPKSKPLFSADFDTMGSIEEWEGFARWELQQPVAKIFRQALTQKSDVLVARRATEQMHKLADRLEKQLRETAFLVGETMTAADVVALAALTPEKASGNPMAQFFQENLQLGEEHHRTRIWLGQVLAYDH